MISKTQLSFVRSLHQKKFRQMYGKFLVEGQKLVNELLLSDWKVEFVFKTKEAQLVNLKRVENVVEVTPDELSQISTQAHPHLALAVVYMPAAETIYTETLTDGHYLLVDQLSDPGNAGTIIRTAEWFGIEKVFFSEGSVEIFNPKVVAAAKGSLLRVKCYVTDLKKIIQANPQLPVYGTFMKGESIYKTTLENKGFVVIGNEANGISPTVAKMVTTKLSIPSFGKAESLNAAIATGVVLSEFKRLA